MAAPFRLTPVSVALIEQYLKGILEVHKAYNDLRNKMVAIDEAYYRYKTAADTEAGVDEAAAATECDATESDIQVPIVISQVDSFVGYMAEVYLSGYPMFPVISEPANKREAEMLESIVDTHATLGGYARQFLLAFRAGMRYNFMPIEHSWEPIDQYKVVVDYLKPAEAAKLDENSQNYTRILSLDAYNTVWDFRVDPCEVCYKGEFAGYIEIEPRIPMKQFINRHSKTGLLYNISELEKKTFAPESAYYTELPQVNKHITKRRKSNGSFDWVSWLGVNASLGASGRKLLHAGIYEKFTCYARIIPSEFKIENAPKKNTPQIWKFIFINGQTLIYAKPIFTMYDVLPILIGQPCEDRFGIQTESIGEGQIPFQQAATTLFGIRFNAARRAVSDRALYDPTLISSRDVNTRGPAPKIPVRLSGLNDKDMERAYKQIPFDSRGTLEVLQDLQQVLALSDKLSGQNKPSQGQFQKGNKSVQEWQDTMGGADNRLRLPALMTEFQVMIPIKSGIKLNIFQYGVSGIFQNFNTGNSYDVTGESMVKLQGTVLNFRMADGFTPKSKMASTEFISTLIQMIGSSEILMQGWGAALPSMIAHLAQLGGVRGMEQYLPPPPTQQQQSPQQPPQGVPQGAQGGPPAAA